MKERKDTIKFTRTKDIFSTEKMQSQVIFLMLLLSSQAFRPTYKQFHLKQHFQNVNGLKKIKIVLIRVKRSKQKNKQGTLVYVYATEGQQPTITERYSKFFQKSVKCRPR